jgi:DNA-binding GntR family transcriptional regulator
LRGFVETLASTTSLAVLLYDQSEAPSRAVAEHRELVRLLEQGKSATASALMTRHLGRNQQRQEWSHTGAAPGGDGRAGAMEALMSLPRIGKYID